MCHKSKAAFIIMACLLVAIHCDQALDCRKMVYSSHCRGVAIKRGDIRNMQKHPAVLEDKLSLKRLFYDLSSRSENFVDDVSQRKKPDGPAGNELHTDNIDLDRLFYKLLMTFKKQNLENDYLPFFEY